MAAPNSTFCVSTCCAQPELNDGAHQKRPRAKCEPALTVDERLLRESVG